MATGDQDDMIARAKALIPNGWFPSITPVLDIVLSGPGLAMSYIYGYIAYAKLQTRIKTASDYFLDLIAFDFFGLLLQRRPNETDSSLLSRILLNLLVEKATRNGMVKVLTNLTGQAPIIFEPWNPSDTAVYGRTSYGRARYGNSTSYPYQCFITVTRPLGQGIPRIPGYGQGRKAYGRGQNIYISKAQVASAVADTDIYAAISDAKVAGTIPWTQIVNPS